MTHQDQITYLPTRIPIHAPLARPYPAAANSGVIVEQSTSSESGSQSWRLRFIPIVCLTLALVCVMVIAASHLVSTPDRVAQAGLMLCGDTPCYRGLIPGQISWSEAVTAFDGASSGEADLLPSSDGRSLEAVTITRPLITVGEIMAQYGAPTCVSIYQATGALVLHYSLLHVLVRFSDNRFSPENPILSVVLAESPVCDGIKSGTDNQTIQRVWRGFASLSSYLDKT